VQGIIADRGRTHGDWSSTADETKHRELEKSTPVALQTSEGTLEGLEERGPIYSRGKDIYS
jgi:hypothetical protein